jgi:arabinosyltransferase C
MRHRPDGLVIRLPCALPPAIARDSDPINVFSTVRTDRPGGLRLLRTGDELAVWAGGKKLASAALSTQDVRGCAYTLSVTQDSWTLSGGMPPVARAGRLASAPVTTGLFSELDLAKPGGPNVVVTTASYASEPTRSQSIAWLTAALAAAAALILIGANSSARPGWRNRSLLAIAGQARTADLVVAATLLAWWVLAPVMWDDGWIVARSRTHAESGGFANYYDALGTNLPIDFWVEWLQSRVTAATSSVLLWRLPALVALGALWVTCRWILRLLLQRPARRAELLAMTAAFLGSAIAWGMTVRPEPFIALLVGGVLACAVAFRRSPSALPLVIAATLIPLAIAGHHTGLITISPLLAIAPTIASWARGHVASSLALIASSSALLITLTTVGADLSIRLADAQTTSKVSGSGVGSWYEELGRYERLGVSVWATPPRRGTVALMLLLGGFFLLRSARTRELLDVPARSLVLALGLLFFTPSKLPWHFGALIGLIVVAAGAESSRLSREAARATALSARSLLFVAAMLVAGGWALAVRGFWNPVDLGTLQWRFAFERASGIPLQVVTTLLPLFALCAFVLIGAVRRRDGELYAAPWRVASLAAPILMIPLLVLSFAVFVVDMARSTWTIREQNIEALLGRDSCGIADHLEIATPDGTVARLSTLLMRPETSAYISPEIFPYFPCARQPRLSGGVTEPPDYVLMSYFHRPFIFRASPFEGVLDLYPLDRLRIVGPYSPKELELYVVRKNIPGAEVASPDQTVIRE